jgi:hypothetical protein
MDSIDVPIYKQSGRIGIDDALGELRRKERGGVLIQDGNRYRLLFAGDLLRARRAGVLNVQDVSGGEPVMVTTEEHAISHGLDLHEPHRTRRQFENILDYYNHSYTLPMPSQPSTTGTTTITKVVTRSEDLGQMLRMTGGYECTGEPKHFFPRPYVRAGDNCPRRPECSRADGSTPKVISSS